MTTTTKSLTALPGKQLFYLRHLPRKPYGPSPGFLRALLAQIGPGGATKTEILDRYSQSSHAIVARALEQLLDDRQIRHRHGFSGWDGQTIYELT